MLYRIEGGQLTKTIFRLISYRNEGGLKNIFLAYQNRMNFLNKTPKHQVERF